MTSFSQVPEHGGTVLATRGAKRSIRRHSDGVNVSSVSQEVGAELAVSQVPDLDNLVPSGRDDERDAQVRRESDARNPFLVTFFVNGEFALTEGVP